MNFDLTEDQKLLIKNVRDLCVREIAPHAKKWDEEERFPTEVIPKLAAANLLGLTAEEEYGGMGMSLLDYTMVIEELARWDGSICLTVASHNSLCTGHIRVAGSEEQKRKYVPRLASGEVLGAWGLTEPGSGSDAAAARTSAVRKGDGWVLNGAKTFITQGSVAGIFVILASTSPEKKQKGLTAFILEAGMPGFRAGKKLEKMGLRASDTAELIMEDVEVPEANRLGKMDAGFTDTLRILERGRIGIASMAVGLGRGALEEARNYAKQRVQFGVPLAEHQAIQMMIADMATELDASRLLVRRAAWLQDQGQRTPRESSSAKLYAAQAAMRACDASIQIHGGYGYTRDFPVERYLRDCKLCEIGEGTNEVQRMILARHLFGRGVTEEILRGDVRAGARLMRDLDDRMPGATEALRQLYPHTGKAFILGITGNPGAGKSTVVDALIERYRAAGKKVGVVCVDPTSPFSGGAILGDRIRMQRHATDPGVFIRSMATRGHLGGLSRSTTDVVTVLDAMGYDVVIIETVGVGQDEIDIMAAAQTAVVVTVPGLGDDIQAIKAGILEIADVLVVNKADREGADRAVRDLIHMLDLRGGHGAVGRKVEIVKTVAVSGVGIDELITAVDKHRELTMSDGGARAQRRAMAQLAELIKDRLVDEARAVMDARGGLEKLAAEVAARTTDPYAAAEAVVAAVLGKTS